MNRFDAVMSIGEREVKEKGLIMFLKKEQKIFNPLEIHFGFLFD
jgi:hypothetical protein